MKYYLIFFVYYTKYARVTCLINNYVITTSLTQSIHFKRYMAPTAVLKKMTTTTIKRTTATNNNLSAYIANTSVVNSPSFFGDFQNTAVGNSELTIRTILTPTINAESYRKTMIAIFFFAAFFLSLPLLPFLLAI